jgi:hypothetical protein
MIAYFLAYHSPSLPRSHLSKKSGYFLGINVSPFLILAFNFSSVETGMPVNSENLTFPSPSVSSAIASWFVSMVSKSSTPGAVILSTPFCPGELVETVIASRSGKVSWWILGIGAIGAGEAVNLCNSPLSRSISDFALINSRAVTFFRLLTLTDVLRTRSPCSPVL